MKMKIGVRRPSAFFGFAYVLAVAVVLMPTPVMARDDQLHYDTSKCSTDPHEMVYFAVGRRVFRQPIHNISRLQGYSTQLRARANLPHPPKPSEPEGCPDHPIQAMGYYLRYFSAMPEDGDKILYANADKVPLEVINALTPGLNPVDAKTFDLICSKYNLKDTSIPGFMGCSRSSECDHGASYQANDYPLPLGQTMTLNCTLPLHYCEDTPGLCSVSYKLFSDLSVWYKFKTANVPIKDALDYDRELQRRIKAAEVAHYPWPDDETPKMEGSNDH
jgi:hypothetical protein